MKDVNPHVTEKIIHEVALQMGKSKEEIRAKLMETLTTEGCEIAISTDMEITLLAAHLGEHSTIEHLKLVRQGLPYWVHWRVMQDLHSAQARVSEKVTRR